MKQKRWFAWFISERKIRRVYVERILIKIQELLVCLSVGKQGF